MLSHQVSLASSEKLNKLAFRSKRNRGLNLKNTNTIDSYFLEHSIIVKGKNIVSYTLK